MDLALSFWSAAWRAALIQVVVLILGGGAATVLSLLDLGPLAGLLILFMALFPVVWLVVEWRRQFLIRRGRAQGQPPPQAWRSRS